MRLGEDRARELFTAAPVARLATMTPEGEPHVVPIVFVAIGSRIVTAVDAKPKSTPALQRLANVAAQPRVSVLADHYDDDWEQLWWVRADGRAHVVERDVALLQPLVDRYPQYAEQPPPGPLIVIDVDRWTGWRAAP